jgi:hypothetical protein
VASQVPPEQSLVLPQQPWPRGGDVLATVVHVPLTQANCSQGPTLPVQVVASASQHCWQVRFGAVPQATRPAPQPHLPSVQTAPPVGGPQAAASQHCVPLTQISAAVLSGVTPQ